MNIWLKSISVNHNIAPKLFIKHSSFQQYRQQYNPHKRTHPKQHLKPKVYIFHYFFAKKSYLIRAIQSKPVTGINYIYNSILLYFQFLKIYLSNYVKSVATHFQFHTKMRTPHHSECKKATE